MSIATPNHILRPAAPRTRMAGLAALLALAALIPAAWGQAQRDAQDEALDQRVAELEIKDKPIDEALQLLEQRTKLRFQLDPAVMPLMPYGQRTRVNVVVRDMTVRSALTQVFAGLGLELRVLDDHIRIEPIAVMRRLGRRASVQEVALVERLAREAWPKIRGGSGVTMEFRLDPESAPMQKLESAIAKAPPGSALRQLEFAAQSLGWSWHPEGEKLIFENRVDDIRRRLEQRVDLNYQRMPLDELMVNLGARVGVTFAFEPGSLQRVSARDRSVDLVQRGASIRQVLERICGNTGLRYEITPDGVLIRAPQPAGSPPAGGATTVGVSESGPSTSRPAAGLPEPRVQKRWVRVSVDLGNGITLDYFLTEDQLPPELRKLGEQRLREILGNARVPSAASPQ